MLRLPDAFLSLTHASNTLSLQELVCLSQKCRKYKHSVYANRLLEYVTGKGLKFNATLGNHLVPMLIECGCISSAQEVFDGLTYRNVYSWTSLMSGYIQCDDQHHAWHLYMRMQDDSVDPSSYTLVALVKACIDLRDLHNTYLEIVHRSFERDTFVGSTLIDAYCKHGALAEALSVFEILPFRNVVSWTALISGYVERGSSQEALKCYSRMTLQGLSANDITLVCILKACSNLKNLETGRDLHTETVLKGFVSKLFVGSALVDMYAKCGSLSESQDVFSKLPVQDVVSWNALIAGYVEHGPAHEALYYFEKMHEEGIAWDSCTSVYVLKACGILGCIDKGLDMHTEIIIKGYDADVYIGNTLVDMYAKCGFLLDGRQVFDKLQIRDVVSWNALINGYSTNHEVSSAIHVFECMLDQTVAPDAITFTSLLSACTHGSFTDKGCEYFKLMIGKYRIAPTIDHLTCLIKLLARAGKLHEAEKFLDTTISSESKDMWLSLLSACKICSEVDMAFRCFQRCIQIDPACSTPYTLMANVYYFAGRPEDAYKMENMRRNLQKTGKEESGSMTG